MIVVIVALFADRHQLSEETVHIVDGTVNLLRGSQLLSRKTFGAVQGLFIGEAPPLLPLPPTMRPGVSCVRCAARPPSFNW